MGSFKYQSIATKFYTFSDSSLALLTARTLHVHDENGVIKHQGIMLLILNRMQNKQSTLSAGRRYKYSIGDRARQISSWKMNGNSIRGYTGVLLRKLSQLTLLS
jgi:hypothetical protein